MPRRKAKNKAARDAQVTVIFGTNGTGKSYLARQLITAIGGRALVVTYAGMPKIWHDVPIIQADDPKAWQNWTSGIRQVIAAQYEDDKRDTKNHVFEYIFRYYRGGSVVFDDCREYISSNRLSDYPYLKKLLSAFRHVELDVFFVMHGPGDVPRQIWNYTRTTFVGHTNATITKSDIRSAIADEIIKAQGLLKPEFVKRKAQGDGSHRGLFIKIDA